LALASLAIVLSSCQDPAYQTERERRDAYIERNLEQYWSREQVSPANVEAIVKRFDEWNKRHDEYLKKMLKKTNERFESDNRRWFEEQSRREEEILEQLKGDPESIPGTWGRMVY
jgi:hypothetical protein